MHAVLITLICIPGALKALCVRETLEVIKAIRSLSIWFPTQTLAILFPALLCIGWLMLGLGKYIVISLHILYYYRHCLELVCDYSSVFLIVLVKLPILFL